MKRDFFCGVFSFAFGLIIWITIPYTIPHIDRFSHMGPRFFPRFFAIGITVMGFLLALQSLAQRSSWKKDAPKDIFVLKDEVPVLMSYLVMIATCVMFARFKYLISMPVAVTVLLLLYKEKKWYSYLSMYVFIAILYFVFSKVMHVQL